MRAVITILSSSSLFVAVGSQSPRPISFSITRWGSSSSYSNSNPKTLIENYRSLRWSSSSSRNGLRSPKSRSSDPLLTLTPQVRRTMSNFFIFYFYFHLKNLVSVSDCVCFIWVGLFFFIIIIIENFWTFLPFLEL